LHQKQEDVSLNVYGCGMFDHRLPLLPVSYKSLYYYYFYYNYFFSIDGLFGIEVVALVASVKLS